MSLTNSKSLPRGSGSNFTLQSPNWPWPPVCFLCRPCASVAAVIVSRYGNPRQLQVHLDAEPALQLRDRDLDVRLSLPGEQQFLGLRVARVVDRRILFLQAVQRRADLLFVAAALRLDRVRDHRLRETWSPASVNGDGLVGEQIVGLTLLQLRDRADVARLDLRHVGLGLSLQQHEMPEPLRRVLGEVVDGRVRLERARDDAEHRDAPGERVGDRLPDERGRRPVARTR